MRRSVNTPFFPDQGFSMFDSIIPTVGASASPANSAAFTSGKTIIRPAALGGPTESQHWKLISVAVQGYLRFVTDTTVAGVSHAGKFGLIVCALSMDQSLQSQNGDQYLISVSQLPFDTTLLSVLWNQATDPMPPGVPANIGGVPAVSPTTGLAISASISPPNPLDLSSNIGPTVGIWMLPSLLCTTGGTALQPNGMGLDIGMASFTINYDDGL